MLRQFIAASRRLIEAVDCTHHRYLYADFSLKNRLTGLVGQRGVGKTTLLLQFLKEKMPDRDTCIYVSLDHIWFSGHLLFDFVLELYEEYGIRSCFFDEIHKYPGWDQELKNLYDSFPDLTIVFSGSSSIDLVQGGYDLSRRGVLYHLQGMSFREYLFFHGLAECAAVSLTDILENRAEIEAQVAEIPRVKGHFKSYLGGGYYPFALEDSETYHQKILRVVEKAVYEDISSFYRLKTENLLFFKKILSFLATSQPGELSRNSLAKGLGVDNKTVQSYVKILHETGLAELVRINKSGGNLLKTTEKMYLDNADLYAAVAAETGFEAKRGTLREIFFVKMLKNAGHHVFYSRTGDFDVDGKVFEIGGKNKTAKQIRGTGDAGFLVKDDLLYGSRREIPLHLFGFLY